MPDVLEEAERKFTEFLEKKDLKLTSQRRTILREAVRATSHFSADQLLAFCKKADETISKATVYRTLDLLKDSGILEEQDFGAGKKSYERALGVKHHDHFVCIRCGKIIEFENDRIELLQDTVARKHGFVVTSHKMELYGLCRECQRSAEKT